MLSNAFLRKFLILTFMAGVGYSFAKSINTGSLLGAILSVVSLTSAIYFLYILHQIKRQQEESY